MKKKKENVHCHLILTERVIMKAKVCFLFIVVMFLASDSEEKIIINLKQPILNNNNSKETTDINNSKENININNIKENTNINNSEGNASSIKVKKQSKIGLILIILLKKEIYKKDIYFHIHSKKTFSSNTVRTKI
jgi:hypothetical protein